MKPLLIFVLMMLGCGCNQASAAAPKPVDLVPTGGGDLAITCIGHGTLMFTYQGKVIHVDPYSKLAEYRELPKADLIILTHHHRDHLDEKAIAAIRTE